MEFSTHHHLISGRSFKTMFPQHRFNVQIMSF